MSLGAYCQEHKQQYTNFCFDIKCLIPLCPECIADHELFHQNRNEISNQIDSIKNIKFQKLSLVFINFRQHQQDEIYGIQEKLQELLQYEDQISENKNQNMNQPKSLIESQINKAQEALIKEVNMYFASLREQLSLPNFSNNNPLDQKFVKYKSMANELEIIQSELSNNTNSQEFLNWLKNICKIDCSKLKAYCEEEKQILQEQIWHQQNKLSKETSARTNWEVLRSMTILLPKYCYLDDQQDQQHKDVPLLQSSQKANKKKKANSNKKKNPKAFVSVQLENPLEKSQDQNEKEIFSPVQLIVPDKEFSNSQLSNQQEEFQMDDQESSEIQLQNKMQNDADEEQYYLQPLEQSQQLPIQTQRILQFQCKNYFLNSNLSRQFLHYFLPTNELILYNLAQIGIKKFQKIRISQMPQQQKILQSICVPNGDIYAFTSNQVFEFILETKQWNFISSMLQLRENFGIGYVDGYIYIIGGKNLKTVERLNIKTVQQQAHTESAGTLNYSEPDISVCGGWGKVYSVGVYCIETCKVNEHIWTQFLIQDKPIWGKQPGSVCVADGQLMVFGGEDEKSCSVVGEGWARQFGEEFLPIQGAFQNNCCIVQGHLYAMRYLMKAGKAQNYLFVYDKDEGGWTQYD